MCRADIDPTAAPVLADMLAHMAAALRDLNGLPPDARIVIGPVDLGEDTDA